MKDAASAVFLFSVGIFYLISSLEYEAGALDDPGPGLFPRIIGLVIIFTNLFLLFLSLRRRAGGTKSKLLPPELKGSRLFSAGMIVGAVILYLLVLDKVGFLLASPLLVFFLAWVMGGNNWIANLILGVVSSGFIYWLFWIIMRVPIPTGSLWVG